MSFLTVALHLFNGWPCDGELSPSPLKKDPAKTIERCLPILLPYLRFD